jgi:CheY-like chemotaxis protein
MAKIMLVEDDNNLREIYGERLMAEGYEIVSAKDGEEALALAVKEKPDLIISDVMMPKISGFDMLDILRQTPETKNTKVIMMTALSQAEDKQRANNLGADKYLVKSQVTLEYVARVVDDVLNDRSGPMQVPASEVTNVSPLTTEDHATTATTTDASTSSPVVPDPTPQPEPVVEEPSNAPAPAISPAAPVVVPEPIASTSSTVVPDPTPQPEPVAPATEDQPAEQTIPASQPPNAESPNQPEAVVQPDPNSEAQADSSLPINPMTAQTTEPVANPLAEKSSASPESVEEKLSEINQEIENFVKTEQTEVASHQVAMVEPTQAQLDKAELEASKNNNPDPTVIPPAAGSQNINEPASTRKKVINPIGSIDNAPNINELYEKELAAENKDQPVVNPGAGANIESTSSTQDEQPSSTNPMLQSAESVASATVTVNTAPLETADLSQIEGLTTEVSEDDTELAVEPQLAQPPQDNTEASTVNNQAPTDQQPTNPNDPNNIAL